MGPMEPWACWGVWGVFPWWFGALWERLGVFGAGREVRTPSSWPTTWLPGCWLFGLFAVPCLVVSMLPAAARGLATGAWPLPVWAPCVCRVVAGRLHFGTASGVVRRGTPRDHASLLGGVPFGFGCLGTLGRLTRTPPLAQRGGPVNLITVMTCTCDGLGLSPPAHLELEVSRRGHTDTVGHIAAFAAFLAFW